MTRGLLWLPLLAIFIWLAWSGWNEYQKVEAYKIWAADFDNAKFDIYSVLGKKDSQLTWGKPTRNGAVNVSSFFLDDVAEIKLNVNNKAVDLDNLPRKGKATLKFDFKDREAVQIPFTEIDLAAKWLAYLKS